MQESLTFHRNLECVYFRFLGSLRVGPLKSNFLSNLTSELLTQKTAALLKMNTLWSKMVSRDVSLDSL